MALTKGQLEAIQKLIEQRVLKFTLEHVGPQALTTEEIRAVKSMGLIKTNVRNLIADGYIMGKIVSLIHPREEAKALTYKELEAMVRSNSIALTPVEQEMIKIAKTQAGEYIKGLKDRMVKDLKITSLTGREQALNAVRNGVADGIAKRQTISEVKTALFNQFNDRNRDWRRIAHTEVNNSIQKGIYERIKHESPKGSEQLVFKRPNPDACKYCKKLYLESDGITPKIFKISELEETNIGKKAANWQATIGGVHPWCFDDQTEVLTDDGWKLFKDVEDEKILSVNLVTGDSKYTDIKQKVEYHYSGEMHKYKSKVCDLVVTPNHRSVIKTAKNQSWRLQEESTLPKKYSMLGTIPKYLGKDNGVLNIGGKLYPTGLFCEFMGYFLSEGSLTKRHDRSPWQISISQQKDARINMDVCCRALFDKVWMGEGAITIPVSDKHLIEFLSLGKSWEKSIPKMIKDLSPQYLKIFLYAFIAGDGYIRIPKKFKEGNFREERVYYTSSHRLMSDLCELMLKIGKRPSVSNPVHSDVPKKFKNGEYVIKHPCYTIRENWTQNVAVGYNMFREVIDYDGMVYDVELVDNHTLFVKRNGRILLSGNCRCQLSAVPDDYGFELRRILSGTGKEVSEAEYTAMSDADKDKTRLNAVLTYKG